MRRTIHRRQPHTPHTATTDPTCATGAHTATIAPPTGNACINRTRAAINRSPSSAHHPRHHAATYSPTL